MKIASQSQVTMHCAVPEDVPVLVEMIRELAAYEHRLAEVTLDPEELHQALFGARPLIDAVIARNPEGEAVGFALWLYKFATFRGCANLYIEDLYVRPAARGAGVGSRLLEYVGQVAVERHCGRLEWSVLHWNKPALKFYRQLGAAPIEEWLLYELKGPALERLAASV